MRKQGLARQRQPEGALSTSLLCSHVCYFFLQGQSSLGRYRFRRKERQYLVVACCNEEHGSPYRWCATLVNLLELNLPHPTLCKQGNHLNLKISNLLLSWHPKGENPFLSKLCINVLQSLKHFCQVRQAYRRLGCCSTRFGRCCPCFEVIDPLPETSTQVLLVAHM